MKETIKDAHTEVQAKSGGSKMKGETITSRKEEERKALESLKAEKTQALFPWRDREYRGSGDGRRRDRAFLMTAYPGWPSIDLKVRRSRYKDSCSISRNQSRCPGGKNPDADFLGVCACDTWWVVLLL